MQRARLAALLGLIASLSHGQEPATLSDLETLAERGAHLELLERAEEVPVSSRTEDWKNLVSTAAVVLLEGKAVTKDPFARALEADGLSRRHTFLAERQPFLRARDRAALAGARQCLKESDEQPCWKTLAAFEPTLTPAGGLELGRLLRKNGATADRVAVLFARAAGKDAAVCQDADLQDVLIAALDGPFAGAPATAARTVAFTTCWTAFSDKLKKAMKSASAYRLQNACKPMREKRALTTLQEDLCQDENQ